MAVSRRIARFFRHCKQEKRLLPAMRQPFSYKKMKEIKFFVEHFKGNMMLLKPLDESFVIVS
jgi:hypothetical protein